MKYALSLFLSCLMIAACGLGYALEISEEAFDEWYWEMTELVEDIGPRRIGLSDGIDRACAWVREKMQSYGYSYEDDTLRDYHVAVPEWNCDDAVSLVAIKRAKNPEPQIVTVCAHYDAFMEVPGARDNASGMASVLLMMRMLDETAYDDTEIRFIAFSAEESGMQGSREYCRQLSPEERERSIAVFNVDILVRDIWEEECVLSMDTLGMRTGQGYETGSKDTPAVNRAALALLTAKDELGYFPDEDEELTWCGPRHMGKSDHEPFHEFGIDSVNFCVRGNTAAKGRWPAWMHTPSDAMSDFDLEMSWQALEVLLTAVDGLARDHSYGLHE